MPSAGSGRIVSQTELATIFGITPPTIRSWESRGCPVIERGGKGKPARYNTAQVLRWREDQIALAAGGNSAAVDYDEAKRRHMVANAVLAEVEADLRHGSVVLIDDVVAEVVAEYAKVRNLLLGIGSKIAPRAAALKSAAEIKSLVDKEVARALDELTQDKKWTEREDSVAA